MADLTLTKTHILEGHWHGILTGAEDAPNLVLGTRNKTIEGLSVTERADGSGYDVAAAIPLDMISDGVQTFIITDGNSGQQLADFSLLAGEALAGDIRAEVDLLRAELDMLKRAFRRHCLETK